MHITIDADKCCGYGDCVLAAPELFDINDDGVAYPLVSDVGVGLQEQAEQAAASCPVEAIELTS
ncbi:MULTISPECIES: ferredoxin [unclassified Nocardioides]|jgi:ferredoxin|uniref:ferredoxin n=1 Tax=unclassified Nocardioides TaxID=2615069 RepID=UPI0009F07BCF|nr:MULTISPECIES: ferredoxin [unclassified Nocardioides]GAW51823.1 Putative ferredoxin [Nocardioides sp. PD653-B2]